MQTTTIHVGFTSLIIIIIIISITIACSRYVKSRELKTYAKSWNGRQSRRLSVKLNLLCHKNNGIESNCEYI